MEALKANLVKWSAATCIILITVACMATVAASIHPLLFK